MKPTSQRPVKRERQARTPTGMDPPRKGPTPSITEGGPKWNTDLASTQGRSRSLGVPRIKTRMVEKGV